MQNNIRKISIGSDYKNEAMHYAVGQQVYGGHEISHILLDSSDNSYNIHIKKNKKHISYADYMEMIKFIQHIMKKRPFMVWLVQVFL